MYVNILIHAMLNLPYGVQQHFAAIPHSKHTIYKGRSRGIAARKLATTVDMEEQHPSVGLWKCALQLLA